MILGSDSHTRYGALGTLGIGEGGGELVKQLLGRTYDIAPPEVVAVYLRNAPRPGVGPQDVALALIGAVFKNGFVKNKILEFIGDGIGSLPVEYRNGVDVMTTETACLSSIWETDEAVREYLAMYGREGDYKQLSPCGEVCYDGMIDVDLAAIQPMIALPFHPSNIYTIEELNANPHDILGKVAEESRGLFGLKADALMSKIGRGPRSGKYGVYADQGIIAGCAGGTYSNIRAAAGIIGTESTGDGPFALSVYPASQPVYMELIRNKVAEGLINAGVIMRSAFCGPCFGAGDVPANNALSVRHTTRNFPNREGSRPADGQMAYAALMDARSIAATAINGGRITAADTLDIPNIQGETGRQFYSEPYRRVYNGYKQARPDTPLVFGPNIADWPALPALTDNLLLRVVCVITDAVTTTDELIPSGETSAYRSNPFKLAEFTLSRKAPDYVARAKEVRALRQSIPARIPEELEALLRTEGITFNAANTEIGSVIYARKPGDGSAREQAASCQKVLGGWANIAAEYATKRYRSNLINWGLLPFVINGITADGLPPFADGDYIYIEGIRGSVRNGGAIKARVLGAARVEMTLGDLTETEKEILLAGCLINYYNQ
jgi:aconitate hydratase